MVCGRACRGCCEGGAVRGGGAHHMGTVRGTRAHLDGRHLDALQLQGNASTRGLMGRASRVEVSQGVDTIPPCGPICPVGWT